ncbi:hypothetical protein, partial [Pseudomonas tolaasii]|uniref:hypothetical protein n=1 Tax=Pseudomonas tolaasii TaxID=29442 RepID=UPI001C42E8BC
FFRVSLSHTAIPFAHVSGFLICWYIVNFTFLKISIPQTSTHRSSKWMSEIFMIKDVIGTPYAALFS